MSGKTTSPHQAHAWGSESVSRYWVTKDNQEMSRWHVASNSGGKKLNLHFFLFLVSFVPGICLPSDLPRWSVNDAHKRTMWAIVLLTATPPSNRRPRTSATNCPHLRHTKYKFCRCSVKYKESWIFMFPWHSTWKELNLLIPYLFLFFFVSISAVCSLKNVKKRQIIGR